MARLHLTTLGRTELVDDDDGTILSVLSQPKRFALLVYLAIEGSDGFIRRDTVAALFWPEHGQADARANLRKSLYFLRQSLGQDVVVARGDEEIGIDASLLDCDAVSLLSGGDAPVGGSFLEGFHFSGAPNAWEAWLEGVRRRVAECAPMDGPDTGSAGRAAPDAPQPELALPVRPDVGDTRWKAVALVAVLGAVLGAGWGFTAMRTDNGGIATRYDRVRLGTGGLVPLIVQRHYALPPDGSGILFRDDVGGWGSWWKPADSIEESYLPGLDEIDRPAFSPDGEWIAFGRDGQLWKRRLRADAPVVLADSVAGDPGIAWLPNGDVLFEDRHGNLRVSREEGGPSELLATADQVGKVFHVSAMPEGEGALVVGCDDSCPETTDPSLSYVAFADGAVTRLHSGVWMAWPMSDGRVVMVDAVGTMLGAAFDPDEATLGLPVPLQTGVRVSPFPDVVMGQDGSLLYIPGGVELAAERPVWVDRQRQGVPEVLDTDWPIWSQVRSLSISPDGRHVAVGMRGGGAAGERIWVKDLPDGVLTPLTEASVEARKPAWSPDSKTIAFVIQNHPDSSWSGSVRTLPADLSSTAPELLLEHAEKPIFEVSMTRDWSAAAVRLGDAANDEADIAFTTLAADREWRIPFASEANEHGVAVSPDGQWLAYVSEESGRPEVYVRPFPGPGPRVQVSRRGGVEPRWAHSGNEIFYRTLKPGASPSDETVAMVSARIRTDPAFEVESTHRLFYTNGYEVGPKVPLYDVTADDQRFLMITRYTPRGRTFGEVVYSKDWYWSDGIQAKLPK